MFCVWNNNIGINDKLKNRNFELNIFLNYNEDCFDCTIFFFDNLP